MEMASPVNPERRNLQSQNDRIFSTNRKSVRILVSAVKIVFVILVLLALVASKVSILSILGELHHVYNSSSTDKNIQAVKFYWQLLLILCIPNVITWTRALVNGLLCNSSDNRPWPSPRYIILGILVAALEAGTETLLVFCGWIIGPPEIALLMMSGLFSFQALSNFYEIIKACISKSGYHMIGLERNDVDHKKRDIINKRKCAIIGLANIFGFLIQISVIVAFIVVLSNVLIPETQKHMYVGAAISIGCMVILSILWCDVVQRHVAIPDIDTLGDIHNETARTGYQPSARWKANLIAATVRILLYPFLSYLIFRFTPYGVFEVDPWLINVNVTESNVTIENVFNWDAGDHILFFVHIVSSLLGYILSWLACYMTLHRYGLAIPVLLSTPLSMAFLYLVNLRIHLSMFPKGYKEQYLAIVGVLWLGQVVITTYKLFKVKNPILASDEDMFIRPYYNSPFLEQYLILNRYVQYFRFHNVENVHGNRKGSKIFICSTMYREDATEMREMLRSINRIAEHYKTERNGPSKKNHFESHIFFDGGCKGEELLPFAVQLLSLVNETLGVHLEKTKRTETPYGYRFKWEVKPDFNGENGMLFMIHFKDNLKIKNKKRWSQVMYMNYILKYRCSDEGFDQNNAYILTTDADINFKAESVLTLLDMLTYDPHVGAVCARTRPKGYGPIYWYQIFDYAIGHWLQKPAEHILGSVLCCPGCFSLFRCSALQDCLETYSEEVTTANDFLTKDMGEDRWLCTLLVKKGWRLDYCAISTDYTYCPVDFDEFFKQRRRWIPSTIANLGLLVSYGKKITKRNNSVNILFILYQVLIIFSTAISPATVILLVATGFQQTYHIDSVVVIVLMCTVSFFYGLICVFTSQKVQLDTAKLLTFIFSVVMVVVIVGLLTQIGNDLININESRNNHTSFELPVAASTFYLGFFSLIFLCTALLHYSELWSLLHSIWYLIGLPSGYLVLLIYSAANLNSRSWGTRESSQDKADNSFTLLFSAVKHTLLSCIQRCTMDKQKYQLLQQEEDSQFPETGKEEFIEEELDQPEMGLEPLPVACKQSKNHDWLERWLKDQKCPSELYNIFAKEGYTKKNLVAGISRNELEKLGVKPIGLVRHLEKAAKRLHCEPMKSGIPDTVDSWLSKLGLDKEKENYNEMFKRAGYISKEDVEHLREITNEELMSIGVKKRAHRLKLLQGIELMKIESRDEEMVRHAEGVLQNKTIEQLDPEEKKFWEDKLKYPLHPVPEGLSKANNLKGSLNNLRNTTLIALLLINLSWIILLNSLIFKELDKHNISDKIVSILFLIVYGTLLGIQFIAMILHRLVTLSHYIARLNQDLPVEEDDIGLDESVHPSRGLDESIYQQSRV